MSASTEKNKSVVRRWVKEVFNEHKLDQVEHLKVPNYIDWNPYPGQDVALGGFKSVLISFLSAFPDFRYDVEEELAEGDIVVCIGTWSGTQTGAFMGIPPTGKRMKAKRIDIVRFSGDKMTERWGTGNELKMMKLMGFSPPMEPIEEGDVKAIARRFVEEVLIKKNLGALEDLVDDNAGLYAKGTLNLFLTVSAFPDSKITIDQVVADGDRVSMLLTFTGTHKGEFLGQPPTGKQVSAKQVLKLRIANGKIVESSHEFDLGEALQQVSA